MAVDTAQSDTRMAAAGRQAFWLLRMGFTVAPILFGVDKFFNWTVHWPDYLAGWINNIMPGTAQDFMYFVGGVEIVAGLMVAIAPAIGAPIVAAWLAVVLDEHLHAAALERRRRAGGPLEAVLDRRPVSVDA